MPDCQLESTDDGMWWCPVCHRHLQKRGDAAPRRNCLTYKSKRSRGLGDTIAKVMAAVGIKPCGGCNKRKEALNRWFPYKGEEAADLTPVHFTTPMDVVYPLASGRHGRKVLGSNWDDNELRYSLRSLEENFPNMGRVYVVTEILPKWLKNVVHLQAKDVHTRNKDANLIDKVLLACRSGVSQTFLRLSDDQCLLQPWNGLDVWHMGSADVNKRGKWWRRCQRTCSYLKAQGRPVLYYDCHCPFPVDRDTFIQVAEDAPYQEPPGMSINTMYFNSIDIPRVRMNGQKIAFHSPTGPKKIARLSEGKMFLGYSERGTNKSMRRFLRRRFPEPSRFES